MLRPNIRTRANPLAFGWAAVALLSLVAGCATPPPPVVRQPVFYPLPPAPPRLQFLTSFTREQDLGPRSQNRLLHFLVGPPPPATPVVKPYGVALREGKIYVCDTVARSVAIFDLENRRLAQWRPDGDGRLQTPIHLAFAADGTRYIADTQRGQVMVYDPSGLYLGALTDASGMKPSDVVVLGGKVYVSDVMNHRVVVFDAARFEILFTIPRDTQDRAAALFSPTNLALDTAHRLYVTDTGAFRVQVYDQDGHYLRSVGTHGDAPGQFAMPKGLAVDRAGMLYVVDAAMQAVQLFDKEGRLLLFFGEPGGSGFPLNLPADVSIDYDHIDYFREYVDPNFEVEYLVLVSSQYGDCKVNVYGFGRPL